MVYVVQRAVPLLVALVLVGIVLARAPQELGRWRRPLGVAILAVYLFSLVSLTLVRQRRLGAPEVKLMPLWSYRAALALTPQGIKVESPSLLLEIVQNYLLYMPLGYLLPFTWPQAFVQQTGSHQRSSGLTRVVVTAGYCSLATELAQLFLRIGWYEVDDIFGNILGAVLGYALYRVAAAWPWRKQLSA